MKKITSLSCKMFRICPLPRLMEDLDDTGRPKSEVGYIRAYHDGYCWQATSFPVHPDLWTDENTRELCAVFDAFMRSFRDRTALSSWCWKNAELIEHMDDYPKYAAWYETPQALYRFRMTSRKGDYNLYLNCYVKSAM